MSKNHEENIQGNHRLGSYLPPLTVLLILFLLIFLGLVIGNGVTFLLGKYFDLSLSETMDNLKSDSGIEKRNFIRLALMTSHFFLFVSPPLVLAYFFFKKRGASFLGLKRIASERFIVNAIGGSFLILIAMPFIQFVYYWNKRLPLPEWARTIENNTNEMISNLLVTEVSWEVFFNILVIAILPAIGEELVFRGIIQGQLSKSIKNPHTAIWISAMLFSLTHVQLEGFFPRLILGGLLGYLFYWSRSLWVPIFVHFLYNGLQIVVIYLMPEQLAGMNAKNIEPIPIVGVLISIFLIIVGSRLLKNYNQKEKEKYLI